jgi:glutamate synthase domain-containing protein 2
MHALTVVGVVITLLLLLAVIDRRQRKHAIIANFPILGRFRYLFETVGPPMRQYIVTSNDEERPFSRDQRRWVYASSKKENNYFGFGTDNDLELTPGYLVIRQSTFPRSAPVAGTPGTTTTTRAPAPRCSGVARPQEGLSPELRREHLGDELRLALAARRWRPSTAA